MFTYREWLWCPDSSVNHKDKHNYIVIFDLRIYKTKLFLTIHDTSSALHNVYRKITLSFLFNVGKRLLQSSFFVS